MCLMDLGLVKEGHVKSRKQGLSRDRFRKTKVSRRLWTGIVCCETSGMELFFLRVS